MSNFPDSPGSGSLAPLTMEPVRHEALAPAPMQMELLKSLMERQGDTPQSIDFGAFGRALRRFWPIVVVSVGLCIGGAAWYLKRTPKMYLALGEIGVGQERSELLPSAAARGEDLKSLEMLKSIERQIAGQTVLIEVAKRFDMHHDAMLAGPRAQTGLNDDEVVVAMSKRVTASLERGTRNIVISVEDTEPQRAKDICQAIIDIVVKRDPGAASALKGKALAALENQVSEARSRMESSQETVNAFRAQHPGLPLEESPSDLKTNSFEDRLKALNAEAVKAEEEVSNCGAIVQRIRAAGNDLNALLAVPGLATQEAAVAQRRILGEAMAKFAESDYGPKHPTYQAMRQQIAELSDGLLHVLLSAAKVERAKYEKAQANLVRIEEQIESFKKQQSNFAVVAGDFQKKSRELKASRDAYSAILARLNEEKTNSGYGASALSVAAEPLVPSNPNKPRPKLIMAAAGAAGMAGGLSLVALLMLLDRSIRTLGSGERVLRIPGLAAVPDVSMTAGKGMLIYGKDKDSDAAEAFRSLRAAVSTAGRTPGARSFLFTSARSGEGKSAVAVNFAASLAQQGYRTLIIDANLRAPVLDSVLLDAPSTLGLSDYLAGECDPEAKLCQQTGLPNLFLFSAGVPKAHPGEILNEAAFARLIQESLKWFHRVIVDAPAAGRYADALPLARHADAVCLVVRPGVTRKGEALKTIQRLTASGARPAGFILNAAPEAAMKEAFAGGAAVPFQMPAMYPALPPARA